MSSTLIMVTVSLLLTTIISELHYSGSHHNRAPLPPWVKNFFFNRLSRYVGLADYVITREHVQDVVSELFVLDLGALQRIFLLQKSEITMEVGRWGQVSLGFLFFEKSSQNSPKPVVIFCSSIPCLFCLYMHC